MNDRLRYDFEFSWGSTYARAARLIASTCRVGRVLDLGAGVGSLGAAVETFGFSYLGGDLDPANVEAMRERGRSAFALDLLGNDVVDQVAAEVEQGPPIVAIAALDVIEHLPDLDRTMRVLSDVVDRLAADEPPVLVVSIPNVAHYDLAAKLLLGRWDVTEVGLLDSTHITLFDERRLDAPFVGWEALGRADVDLRADGQGRLMVADALPSEQLCDQVVELDARDDAAPADAAPHGVSRLERVLELELLEGLGVGQVAQGGDTGAYGERPGGLVVLLLEGVPEAHGHLPRRLPALGTGADQGGQPSGDEDSRNAKAHRRRA